MAYHYVKQSTAGRWLVVHDVPGTTTASIDADCLTLGAADREAACLNAERDRAPQPQPRAAHTPAGWPALSAGRARA